MADIVLTFKDCNAGFTFIQREQDFYKEKGFENESQRCLDCRKARKQQKNNNNRGNFGGNRSYGNRW